MRSAALKSRRLRSVTSERATRQLLLCYHRTPPPSPIKVQRVAGWGWTAPRRPEHLWGTVLSNHTARRKAETRMLTLPLCPAQVSARERNGMMHRTHHGRCCWCCRAHRDVPALWDRGKRTNTAILTMNATIADSEESIIYGGKRSIVTASSGRVNVCACGSLYTQIIYHNSSQEHPAARRWLVGPSCVSSGNEHGWSPKLDAKELLMEDKR